MYTAHKMHALEIAIASSSPGGGESRSSPSFSSPNYCNKNTYEPVLEKQAYSEVEPIIFEHFLVKKMFSCIS